MTTIEFQAPWSRIVRGTTVLSLVILALPLLAAIFAPTRPPLLVVVLLIALPPLIVAATLAARVRSYTLTEEAILAARSCCAIRSVRS
jgi:hypothetical protein